MEPILKVTQSEIESIRAKYHTNPTDIQTQVQILKHWIGQQQHLPKNQDDDFLEKFLLRNKFRIEQTKKKLENYYTVKGLHRQYFEEDYRDYVPSKELSMVIAMENLADDLSRLIICRFGDPDPTNWDLVRLIKYIFILLEFLLKYDYSDGQRLVLDLTGISVEHVTKLTVNDLHKVFHINEIAYSGRMLSIDLINAPSIISMVLNLLKLALPQKLYNKINVHEGSDSLIKMYGKKSIPSDYGGDLENYKTLALKWDKVFLEHLEFFRLASTTVSDEKLRVGPTPLNENFGVDGTFKKLNID